MTQKALLPWGQKFDFTRWNCSGHRLHSNVDNTAGVDLEKWLRWGCSSAVALAWRAQGHGVHLEHHTYTKWLRWQLWPLWKEILHTCFLVAMVTGWQECLGSRCVVCSPLSLPDPHSPHSESDKWRLRTSSLGVRGKQGWSMEAGKKEGTENEINYNGQ